MKVLVITNHCLDSVGGGTFASIAFINGFAALFSQVILIYPVGNSEVLEILNPNIIKIPVINDSNVFKKLLNIYLGVINRFNKVIFPTVFEYNPDIIVFDNSIASAGYVKKLKELGKKIITIHHNYEVQYYKGSPVNILYRRAFMFHLKNAERNAVLHSDLNLTLTSDDIILLQQNYDSLKNKFFSKIGIFEPNSSLFDSTNPIKKISNLKFIITGNLGAVQTKSSLLSFLKNEYKLLLNFFPDANLVLAGKNPSTETAEFCKKNTNVKLISNPSDILSIVNNADVYICPINVGGGLKLRILDGLKLGLPVITHKVSARGFEIFEKNGLLFSYSDLEGFEFALVKIKELFKQGYYDINYSKLLYLKEFSFENGVIRLRVLLSDNLSDWP